MANTGSGVSSRPSRRAPGPPCRRTARCRRDPGPPISPSSCTLVRVSVRSASTCCVGSRVWIRAPFESDRRTCPLPSVKCQSMTMLCVSRPRPVDPDREGVEELLDGERAGHARAEVGDGRAAGLPCAAPRPRPGRRAPGRVLRAVPEPLVDVGQRVLARLVGRVGEDRVLQQLGGEAQVALVGVLRCLVQDRLAAADRLDVPRTLPRPAGAATASAGCRRTSRGSAGRSPSRCGSPSRSSRGRARPSPGRAAAGSPRRSPCRWPLVQHPQGLVVQVGVQVALLGQEAA